MKDTEKIKEKFWQGHISSWKRSSVGIQEYCQRAGISKDSFYYWRKKMSSGSNHEQITQSSRGLSTFVPVMVEKSTGSSSMASVFQEDPKWLGEFAASLIRGLR